MKKITLITLFVFMVTNFFAQVVTTNPNLPTVDDNITLYFHADLGTGGLADYYDDIYAHIGVITNQSTSDSDWKYVKADWNENIDACKLTFVSNNLYSLSLSPDLYTYFSCPSDETIEKVALVFRNADGSKEGKDDGGTDIFITIYEDGLNVSFSVDKSYLLDNVNSSITFDADASLASDLEILINDVSKHSESNSTAISYTERFTATGDYLVVVNASVDGQTVSDSMSVCIVATPAEVAVPSGVVDGVTYSGTSVTFVLTAPNKENVLLLGDFNDWTPSNDYLLNKDGERWWITIENLTLGEEYAYQYLVDLEISIADPYAEKVLDPWNDHYILESTYPNLKAYPDGKGDGIVGVVEPGKEDYAWDTEDFTPPSNNKLVVYELLIRDFVESQDIKDVIGKLDYLDELGITAIELMPVSEFEGNNSWGYNPSFYCAFDKNYGTSNDLKMFIDSCHARGMAVIMDLTMNHAFYQNPLVKLYFDEVNDRPAADNPWFNATSPNTEYSWGADFDHESLYTQNYVDRVVEYWMENYRIDGYRLDFTKGFTNTGGSGWSYDQSRINILKRIYDNFQAINPDVYNYLILEHFAEANEEIVLANYGMMIWGNNNDAYMEASMGYSPKSDISNISHKTKGFTYPNLMGYMESHDEERVMFKNISFGKESGNYDVKDLPTALDRAELVTAFFLTVPGPKMIWQFGELGYDVSIDDPARVDPKPIYWNYYEDQDRKDLYDVYAKLNRLRAKYDVFSSSNFTINQDNSPFTKRINIDGDNIDVAVVGNFDLTTQWVEPTFTQNGTWYEFFADDSIEVTSSDMNIELQAGEYKLYATQRLTVSDINDIELSTPAVGEDSFSVYPNPASSTITIQGSDIISSLTIYSITGQEVMNRHYSSNNVNVDISKLRSGSYILRVNNSEFQKIMIK